LPLSVTNGVLLLLMLHTSLSLGGVPGDKPAGGRIPPASTRWVT